MPKKTSVIKRMYERLESIQSSLASLDGFVDEMVSDMQEALYELEQMVDDSSQKITPELYEKMKSMIAYLHDNRNDMSDQLDHEVNQIYTLVTKVIYPVKKFLKL